MEGPTYEPSQINRILHSLPHLNISFHFVNSTFDIHNELYLESLGILASVPALWLILTLLILLLYLLTRCCDKKSRNKSFTCLKCILGLFALFTCGALAGGLYGNEIVHHGVLKFESSLREVDLIVESVKNETFHIDDVITTGIKPRLKYISDEFKRRADNTTGRNLIRAISSNVTSTGDNVHAVFKQVERIRIGDLADLLQLAEWIRWPSVMAVWGLLAFFCLLLIQGVIRHSRCSLVLFSVLGLVAIIIVWSIAALLVVVAVGGSDLCMNPDAWVLAEMRTSASGYIDRSILRHYMECGSENIFAKRAEKSLGYLNTVKSLLPTLNGLADEVFSKRAQVHQALDKLASQLNDTYGDIGLLLNALDCRRIRIQYINMLNAACHHSIMGILIMLASAAGSGLLFTLLVWMDSHTWIYIQKRREYLQMDETDPFLPRRNPQSAGQHSHSGTLTGTTSSYRSSHRHQGSHTHTPPQTPPFPGTLNGRVGEDNPHAPVSVLAPHPNNGQYATLSKQCKTLESSDFY